MSERRTDRVRATERAAANAHLTTGDVGSRTPEYLAWFVRRYYRQADEAESPKDAQHFARLAQQYQHAIDAIRYGG